MTIALFVIGALTSLGCGWNIMSVRSTLRYEIIWLVGGTVGAAMMVTAVLIDRGTL